MKRLVYTWDILEEHVCIVHNHNKFLRKILRNCINVTICFIYFLTNEYNYYLYHENNQTNRLFFDTFENFSKFPALLNE